MKEDKRKNNPIRKKLSAKIYYLAYPKPISLYRISQIIYGLPKGTHKIGPLQNHKEFYNNPYYCNVVPQKKGIIVFSKALPLLDEIENELKSKNIELTENEKKELLKVLNHNNFRELIGNTIPDINWNYDCDAGASIMSLVFFQSLINHYFKKFNFEGYGLTPEKIKEILDKEEKDIFPFFNEFTYKYGLISNHKKRKDMFKKGVKTYDIFYNLDKKLLEKLSKLHPNYKIFTIQYKIFFGFLKETLDTKKA